MVQIIVVGVMGMVAGSLGALLGIGGGVFLMPFLVLVLGLPFQTAVGISLTTVIATSSAVSAGTAGRQLINLRLGMLLEVATAAGGVAGGITAYLLSGRALRRLFGVVTAAVALIMLSRLEKRNVILDLSTNPGRLGGRFFEHESGGDVVYRVRRLPVALIVSFLAGNVSSLLGIGGGTLKVPALNAWCGVPLRAAAATSAFMIGVTAVAAVPIYYARGNMVPELAAAAVLGVLVGSRLALQFGARARAKWLKILMAAVLLTVSVLMLSRAQ
ncbi:MAG: sulfite exporter TauE/SafE family protein [Acidobacteria bacterium]|nr:sulfite exporter TauE/SafE family protein [Acidobacteriota bacterium]